MTDLQKLRAKALAKCTMLPGSPQKRFAHQMAYPMLPGSPQKRFAHQMAYQASRSPEKALTPKQASWLAALAWQYRRQMPRELIPAQNPNEDVRATYQNATCQSCGAKADADLCPACEEEANAH